MRGFPNTTHSGEGLREYAARMAEAEQIARFGVWRWEIAEGRVHWSEQLERIYGLEPGTFGGTVDEFIGFVHEDDRKRVWTHVERALQTLEPFIWEERIHRADGAVRVLLSQGRPIAGPDGAAAQLVGVCQDVTERVAAQRALGHSERRMRAIIDNTPAIVAVKDLDGRYLMSNAETGKILGLHPDEIIGRFCTDLFPAIAEQLRANDRRAAIEMKPVYDDAELIVDGEARTFSTVTFALPDDAGRPVETCTIATDVTELREHESERLLRNEWRRRIDATLREGRLRVYGQPVIELATGQQEWRELLVRMQQDGELLPPDRFLPVIERLGLIQQIDTWMVERAIDLARVRPTEVNLSAVTLCDPHARERIVELLSGAVDVAPRIVFEITETAAAAHLDAACAFARDVTSLGCGLALDDFGTGFGSFTYLRRLTLRYLKIDASFVRDLVHSHDDQRVVRSVIAIAREFGLQTIAEGVEDAATLDLLRQLGADYVQGFHLGVPAELPDSSR